MTTCPSSGKVTHASKQDAHRALSHKSRRGATRQASVDVYRCDSCPGYHVRSSGLKPAGQRASRRR